MKRWMLAWMMLLVMVLAFGNASAEEAVVKTGVLVELESGMQIDLDDDGAPETIRFDIHMDKEGYDTGFTLCVDNAGVQGIGYSVNRALYALRLDDNSPVLLLVSDYGMSDDHQTEFYYWQNEDIHFAGVICAMPENMAVAGNGVITTKIRADVLCTWFREGDFALAYGFDEAWNASYYMYEIPRWMYQMGMIVTLKADLPLLHSMSEDAGVSTVQTGRKVVLCATDDAEWIYVQTIDGYAEGWLRLSSDSNYECIVGDEIIPSYELFDGLLFAD